MDRQFIISEIQRTAENGKALGQIRFSTETGIKNTEWLGRYWARWGDAVEEAGYSQNEWQMAYEEKHVLASLLRLTRKLGRYPTMYEIKMEHKSDPNMPGYDSILRLGSRSELKEKLLVYCRSHAELADLEGAIQAIKDRQRKEKFDVEIEQENLTESSGYVYLVRAQNAYKIGCTRAPYRRVAEIANQSANGAELIHLIPTDDPEGIEKYWHTRFQEKRIEGLNKQSGEWFRLSNGDIKAFQRRKVFM
jgi:hypothetical protein